jgi:branched-chain amino acid transport system ATP-binding protein
MNHRGTEEALPEDKDSVREPHAPPTGVRVGSSDRPTAMAARQIVKRFGGIHALDGASIEVPEGDVVGLVGPNGSGKTTFLSILLGTQRPNSGSVSLFGQDITSRPANHRRRRKMAATFQTPQLIDSLSAVENLIFASRLKHFPGGRSGLRERVAECLKGLTLGQVLDAPAKSLSGGQRKLVELGRALIVEPDVILLDEPTAGVAPSLEPVIGEHIEQARRRGAAILLVSHNLPWTFGLCNRVTVFAQGRPIAEGTPDDVQRNSEVIDAYLH